MITDNAFVTNYGGFAKIVGVVKPVAGVIIKGNLTNLWVDEGAVVKASFNLTSETVGFGTAVKAFRTVFILVVAIPDSPTQPVSLPTSVGFPAVFNVGH